MKTLISILEKTSSKQGLLLLTVLYALVFGLIISAISKLTDITGGIGILDFDRGYTYGRVIEVFSSYGEAGMSLYSRIQMLDLLNPAIYSLLISSLVYLSVRCSKSMWLSIVPLFAGLLDYLENLTLYFLVKSYPNVSEGLVSPKLNTQYHQKYCLVQCYCGIDCGRHHVVKKPYDRDHLKSDSDLRW